MSRSNPIGFELRAQKQSANAASPALDAIRLTILDSPNEPDHDLWFRQQVEWSLGRIARGEARLIPHDKFWDEIEAHARELMRSRLGLP